MYLIKRVSTVPGSPLTVQVDGRPDDSGDGGFQGGGVYLFQPAGQDDDQHQVPEHAARAIMSDPGLRVHFECSPALPEPEPEPAAANEAAAEPDSAGGGKRRRKTTGQG